MRTPATLSKEKGPEAVRDFSGRVLAAVRKVLPSVERSYALHEPSFDGREAEYLRNCIDTRMVSSVGGYVDRMERMLEEYTGAKHAVAVVNGTAGLQIALRLAGVVHGDEVLVPALTFVATANAVVYCGGTPHFIDSEEATLGLDPEKLRDYLSEQTELRNGTCVNRATGKTIRAMVPMHTFGHPSDLGQLMEVAERFHLALVEDAAESLGSFYRDRHTGTLGQLGVVSFNGNKIITTGGGGAILTNQPNLAQRAKHLTTTAKLPHPWEYRHDEIGHNYRLPNLNAALGCAQMEQMPSFIAAKRQLHDHYRSALKGITGLTLFEERNYCRSNYWLETVLLGRGLEQHLRPILENLHREKIFARPAWTPLHQLKPYRSFPRMNLQCAESLAARILNLPSSPALAGEFR